MAENYLEPPARFYKKPFFWFVAVLSALFGGFLLWMNASAPPEPKPVQTPAAAAASQNANKPANANNGNKSRGK